MLGDFHACSEAIGPGKRAGIWVRGCSIGCAGCATPQFIPAGKVTHETEIVDIVERIERAQAEHDIEGVTFSGGEPFEQSGALALVAQASRRLGLSVMSWSGYTIGDIRRDHARRALLDQVDVLIDGPFVIGKGSHDPYRGSSNQVVHFLTNRYGPKDFRIAKAELVIDENGITGTGVFGAQAARTILTLLGVRTRA